MDARTGDTGLVAGAFILASLERVFNLHVVKPTYRLALLTALALSLTLFRTPRLSCAPAVLPYSIMAGDCLLTLTRDGARLIRGYWGSEGGHFILALVVLERHAATVPWREIGGRAYPLAGLNDALADAEALRPKALVDPRQR